MRFSIFRNVESEGKDDAKAADERTKRWYLVHFTFKTKIFLPIVRWIERASAKFFVKNKGEIPNEPFNENLLLLWDTFEEAQDEWWHKFKGLKDNLTEGEDRQRDLDAWVNREKENWYRIPKLFLKLYSTIYLEDTAYREQGNVFLYTLYKNLAKKYGNKRIVHPMYVVGYDYFMPYFIEWMRYKGLSGNVQINIQPQKKYVPAAALDITQFIDFAIQMEEKIKDEKEKRRVCEIQRSGEKASNKGQAEGTDIGGFSSQTATPGRLSGSSVKADIPVHNTKRFRHHHKAKARRKR